MADYRQISINILCKILNSFQEYGQIAEKEQFSLIFEENWQKIAIDRETRQINGYKFSALLFDQLSDAEETSSARKSYEEQKRAAALRAKEKSAAGRDIGKIPDVANPTRKESCRYDLAAFLKTYFPETFNLPWSDNFHVDTISAIQHAAIYGGNFALAIPRGCGKTAICRFSAVWATLYNHRKFIVLIGAEDTASNESFSSIKLAFETNPLLMEDFPEVCYPAAALEGITNRCAGQLCEGKNTYIQWSDKLVYPHVPGSAIAGNAITATSITGRIRGISLSTADGRNIRPDFVIIDDPQTYESARSLSQVHQRISIIQQDIAGLAGVGTKITSVMPCTVIQPNDVADQLLDRHKHPEWHGKRCGLINGFPENMGAWQRYWEIRSEEMRNDSPDHQKSNAFYAMNKKEMDAGVTANWLEHFNNDEISAVQNAMNLYFVSKSAFFSEYQNTPETADLGDGRQITEKDVFERMDGLPEGFVPQDTFRLTMGVDVQANVLYYVVLATSPDFSSRVVERGVWPPQNASVFETRNATPTYGDLFPGSQEAALRQALEACVLPLVNKTYVTEGGQEIRITRCLIDAGWQTQTVYDFVRDARNPAIMPSKGLGINATSKPISETKRRPGEIVSKYEWRVAPAKGQTRVRILFYDANWWKSFMRQRLQTSRGEPGHLVICGEKPDGRARLFAAHLTAEFSKEEISGSRRCDIWKLLPNRENHWLDCLSVSMIAASEQGCALLLNPPTASGKEATPYRPQQPSAPPAPKTYNSVRKTYATAKRY